MSCVDLHSLGIAGGVKFRMPSPRQIRMRSGIWNRGATIPRNPITGSAPRSMQIITGNYRLTSAYYRHIAGIYMVFTIKNVYCYRRLTDKVGLFTADYRRE